MIDADLTALPCETCAFRDGTEANTTTHTWMLFEACVRGIVPFYCHEKPDICRGWVGAVNMHWEGRDLQGAEAQAEIEVGRIAAEIMSETIAVWKAADEARHV